MKYPFVVVALAMIAMVAGQSKLVFSDEFDTFDLKTWFVEVRSFLAAADVT